MHQNSIRDPPGTGNGSLTVARRRLQTPAQRKVARGSSTAACTCLARKGTLAASESSRRRVREVRWTMDAGEAGAVVAQGTLYLKPFDCDVPLLHLAAGDFVPLVSLCELLGLPAAPYASLACQRFRPENAVRRLPFRASDSSVRRVWCLDQDRIALSLMSPHSQRVAAARRDHLLTFPPQALAG